MTLDRGVEALLVLEDGSTFRGRSFGASGEAFGEAVFNTGMSGYQEVLTDPSYADQVVVMTAPHQGNYGVNREDPESGGVQVAAFAVREASRRASSWRADRTLSEELEEAGVVGIDAVDTRRLTLRIRDGGAMRCVVSTQDLDPESLLGRVRAHPGMEGADLARRVSTPFAYEAAEVAGLASSAHGRIFRVAAYDYGIKRNILRSLAATGIEATVYPATTPASEILDRHYDGVFLSNGPGDPAATTYGIRACRHLLGHIPVFGICLGHQLMARALGLSTYKLKFGHRGTNQPVLDLDSGRVEITSHNHGFAVDPYSVMGSSPPTVADAPESGGAGGGEGPAEQRARAAIPRATDGDPSALREWEGPPPPDSPRPAHRERVFETEQRQPRRNRARSERVQPRRRSSVDERPDAVETEFGLVRFTHWNLNDGTLEGLRCNDIPAFSVQYHPEAAPGPHDASYLFHRFRTLMEANA
jgi:carbamoyl-phosphate synthase small subunit